ncbi:MAG: hypothetical protein EOP02_21375 [Proteobacteria bacterium]|jgi:hypothetical protein|nr:MAG: hypothetical protein EOP02_21375 [Pseudomonadota bacterium]
MITQLKRRTDLIVQSFAYVAGKLAQSPDMHSLTALHQQILGEAEKHCSAIRMLQRDVFQSADAGLRSGELNELRFRRLRDRSTGTAAMAQDAIARIASQYAPQKIAA